MRRRVSFRSFKSIPRWNHRFGRRLTAAVLCAAIAGQTALADAALSSVWSERRRAVSAATLPEPLPPLPRLAVNPAAPSPAGATFASLIPADVGTLRSTGAPSAPVSVLLIQDIHLNTEAQTHIAAALSSLFKSKSIDLVGLEGAEGSLGIERLVKAPDPNSLSLAARFLLEKNLISGAADAAIEARASTPVIGLDDERLHEENAAAYRRSVPAARTVKAAVARTRADLSRRKNDLYRGALRSFDRSVAAYRDGRLPFADYARMLVTAAHRIKQPVPFHLGSFVALTDLEKSLDLSAVEEERSEIVARLSGRLNDASAHRLLELGNAFRAGLVSHAAFYAEFATICRSVGIDLQTTPALSSYLRYIADSDSLDPDATLQDAGVLESSLYAALARTNEERRLVAADRQAYLTARLVSFEMTRPEWDEYAKSKSQLPSTKSQIGISPFEDFYRLALKRDAALADHLLAAIENHHARRIAVVAGGFHADGLLRRLAARGIATAVFTPALTHVEADGAAYLSVFTREKTPVEKLLEGRALFLAQNPLSPAAAFSLAQLEASRAVATGQPVGPQESYVEQATGFHVDGERTTNGSSVILDEHTPQGKPVRVTVASVSAAGFQNLPEIATRAPRRWRWQIRRTVLLAWTRLLSFGSRGLGALASALQPAPLSTDSGRPSESGALRYERARPSDWDAIVALRRSAHSYGVPQPGSTGAVGEERLKRDFDSITRARAAGVALVARRGADVIGYVVAPIRPDHVATISDLVVAEPEQGRGVGKALFGGAVQTLLHDDDTIVRVILSDVSRDRRTTAIAREFGFEEYLPRELRLSVNRELIPVVLERIAQRTAPRHPADVERSRRRLNRLRAFLARYRDRNIVGLIVVHDTASGRATEDTPLHYILLTRSGSIFIAATPEEMRFHQELASRFDWMGNPMGAVSVEGPGALGDERDLDMAIQLLFLPVELSGGQTFGNPLPGAPVVQDWVVVGRSPAREQELTDRINRRIGELRDALESSRIAEGSPAPTLPGGPLLPFLQDHFPGRTTLSFADLETGSGRFVGNFRRLLARAFDSVDAIGAESDPQYVTETGETIVQARPGISGEYESAGLTDGSRDIVTINAIHSANRAWELTDIDPLINQAVRIVRPGGLIVVTFQENAFDDDPDADTMVDQEVFARLEAHGFTVQERRFPTDYPRSDVFTQSDDLIFVAFRQSTPNEPPSSPPPPSRRARLWAALGRMARAIARVFQPAFLSAGLPAPHGSDRPAAMRSPWITDPEVTLTHATPNDLDAILALRRRHFERDLVPGWMGDDPREKRFLDDFHSLMNGRTYGVFMVLRRKDTVIGYAYAKLLEPEQAGLMENVVARSERGKGFGRAMFAERLRLLLRERPDLTSVFVSDGSRSYRTSRTAARFGFTETWIRKMKLLLNPSLRTAVLEELEHPGAPADSRYSAVMALNRRYAERYLDVSNEDHARFPFMADFRFSLIDSGDGPGYFVPTSVMDAALLLEAAGVGPGTTMVDATGLDGRIALTAAALGANAVSIEPDARFHAMAGEMSRSGTPSPGPGSVTLLNEDFRGYDFSQADVVHGSFAENNSFEQQLVRQLKPGAVVILTSSPAPFTDPSLQPFEPDLPALHHQPLLRPRFYRKVSPQAQPGGGLSSVWAVGWILAPLVRLSAQVVIFVAYRLYRSWRAAMKEVRLTFNAKKFVFRDHENLEFWGWQKRAAGVALIYVGMVYLPLKLGIFLAASTTFHPAVIGAAAVVAIPVANIVTHGLINTFWLLVEPVYLSLLWASRRLENASLRAAARSAAGVLEPAMLIAEPGTPEPSKGRSAKYPTKKSVKAELARRAAAGLPNNPGALKRGAHADSPLYTAARRFGVSLPTHRGESGATGLISVLWTEERIQSLRDRGWSDRQIAALGGTEELLFSAVIASGGAALLTFAAHMDPLTALVLASAASLLLFVAAHLGGLLVWKDGRLERGPTTLGGLADVMLIGLAMRSLYLALLLALPFGTMNIFIALPAVIVGHALINATSVSVRHVTAPLSQRVADALVAETPLGARGAWVSALENDLRSQRATVGVAGMMDRRLPALAAMDRRDFPMDAFLSDLQAELQARNALHRTEPATARQAAETVVWNGLTRVSAETALTSLNEHPLNVVVFDGMRAEDADKTVARLKADPNAPAIVIYDPNNEATWTWLGQVQKLPNVRLIPAGSAFGASATGGRRLRLAAVEEQLRTDRLMAPSLHVFAGKGLELDLDGLAASSPFRAALFTILDALASVTTNFNRMSLLNASYRLLSSQA